MGKFHGSLELLQEKASDFGLKGKWVETINSWKFTTLERGVLQWYPGTGTLQVQGPMQAHAAITAFITTIDENVEKAVVTDNKPKSASTAAPAIVERENPLLFVVYGHDEESRDQLEFILNKLNINPFILAKADSEGQTIIEALEKRIGHGGSASAGIILLTPDDEGFAKRDGEGNKKDRARQNVILEMGMILGSLGRRNTIILVKGDIERPSDTDGIIYISYKKKIKEVTKKLVQRLEPLGFTIDHKKVTEIS